MNDLQFDIVTLPDPQNLKILNELKDYFYQNGFRFQNKPNTSDAHITLAEGKCKSNQFQDIKELLENKLKGQKPFKSSYLEVTNDKRGPMEGKCQFDSSWVALLFDDANLNKLSSEIDEVLRRKGISTTDQYISKINNEIYKGKDLPRNVIANHINLCNYCRPEKAEEAKALIEKAVPKEIAFDRIVLRLVDATIVWNIQL